ncbi:zinc finger protein 58-like isoform X1 [Cloeon dipterum]|uniref:zinc finger protein 58-like isoform X1 n=1 Tax=Cloeon dipterum TaxID=197152 RepID=UPI00321FF1D4
MKLRGKEGKAPIQKPLCRLCECPTSDGHVLASQVDRFKLRKWAMEVMNLTEEDENLPDVVEEDALICYFCIWQAEFGDESGDESVAWWPKKLDLEENARVLRENYSVGEVEQCWVQLEEVDLAKYTKESPKKRKFDIDLAKYEKEIPLKGKYGSGVCSYCGKRCNDLRQHVRGHHKEAIKCGIRGFMTFFHTEEEKEQHMQEDLHSIHKNPRREICCEYCEKVNIFSSLKSWRMHMNRKHPELVACTHRGCKEFFKSKSEMILHINSHKQAINKNLYLCKHCEYFATRKNRLRQHEEAKHMPKIFKCDSCGASFGSKLMVKRHFKQCNILDKCKSCSKDVALKYKARHRKSSVCSKCKLSFECAGLYQLHREKCKQPLFSCEECGKSFNERWKLNRHVRQFHTKSATFRCDHCDYSAFYKAYMADHIQWNHFPKTIRCEECNTFYASERILKIHKRRWHEYIRCAECGQEERRHNMTRHRRVKTCRHCKCKLKCSGLLQKHINKCYVHANRNNFYCDKCPRIFCHKRQLFSHFVRMHNDV